MAFNFDEAIDEIQEAINRDAQNTFSEEVINRFHNPKYMGSMKNPQGYAKIKGSCGDSMEIFLSIHDEKITSAQFLTDGCATTVVAGSMACELAIGKDIKDTGKISQDEILNNLGGLPEENVHCALLASDTLIDAANNYSASRKE
ncbi:MAG: iron-sulfur cluster assembly scaffold protein [Thermodesulfobacteriota bacterium]|nr:iron-sulfur cluster assembly scaffold protein [Thermodesulfobacteriota bacterium]